MTTILRPGPHDGFPTARGPAAAAGETATQRLHGLPSGRRRPWQVLTRRHGWACLALDAEPALGALAGGKTIDGLAAHCAQHGQRLLLLGDQPRANGAAVQRLRRAWPGLQVAGFAPALAAMEAGAAPLAQVLLAVQDYAPRCVVVDLGADRSQELAQTLMQALNTRQRGLWSVLHRPAVQDEAAGLDAIGLQTLSSTMDAAAQTVLDAIEGRRMPTAFMHANLNTLYHFHTDAADSVFANALRSARAGVFFEGVALKLGHLLLTGRWRPDVSGTDLVPQVLARLARPLRLALVGGRPGVAAKAGQALAGRYPGLQIVGAWDGYADCADVQRLLQQLAQAAPDMVLVGMGTPIQEPLCHQLLVCPSVRVAWAVGGLLDYLSGDARLAPAVVRRIRLEWLWRLVRHPGKYWRRTFVQGPWLVLFLLSRLPGIDGMARSRA